MMIKSVRCESGVCVWGAECARYESAKEGGGRESGQSATGEDDGWVVAGGGRSATREGRERGGGENARRARRGGIGQGAVRVRRRGREGDRAAGALSFSRPQTERQTASQTRVTLALPLRLFR
jgi:hypothetical protein